MLHHIEFLLMLPFGGWLVGGGGVSVAGHDDIGAINKHQKSPQDALDEGCLRTSDGVYVMLYRENIKFDQDSSMFTARAPYNVHWSYISAPGG